MEDILCGIYIGCEKNPAKVIYAEGFQISFPLFYFSYNLKKKNN